MIRDEVCSNSEKEGENVIVQKRHKPNDASFVKNYAQQQEKRILHGMRESSKYHVSYRIYNRDNPL